MGSSLSPAIANIVMEAVETSAIETFPHNIRIWRRYVDDTFVIMKTKDIADFHNHLNNINDSIKFTMEIESHN